jgi:hypothetical protein
VAADMQDKVRKPMVRSILPLLLSVSALACGAAETLPRTEPSDAPAARDRCASEEAPPAAHALAPNQLRVRAAVDLRAPQATTGELTRFEVPLTRYLGPFARNGTSGARTLADYARVHALGTYARLDLRVSGTEGRTIEILIENLHGAGGPRPLEAYDPDDASAPRTAVVVPPVTAGPLRTVSILFPAEQLAFAPSKGGTSPNRFVLRAKDEPKTSAQSTDDACGAPGELRIADAMIEVYAQAPVVLVHGINDTPQNCWADYAATVEGMGFVPDLAVDFGGLADKPGLDGGPPTYNGSVAQDVGRIADRLARIAADYGTPQVHLVGHSKGGLDLVNFLAGPYPALARSGKVQVLSLQTLASPHGGSVLADAVAPLKAWARKREADSLASWPSWGVVADGATDTDVFDTVGLSGLKASALANDGPIEPGLSDLRTTSDAVRTDQQWTGDPSIPFATYGWDADFERGRWVDRLAQLTSPPKSANESGKYATDCRGNPSGSTRWTYYCIDEDEVDSFFWGTAYYPPHGTSCSGWNVCGSPLYRQLARGRAATVESALALGGSRSTLHVDAYPDADWVGNDLTVALPSARHPYAQRNVVLAGAEPRVIDGLRRIKATGGAETFSARCAHTGANHISALRHSRADMVACTAADTTAWIRTSAPVIDRPTLADR